MHIIHVLLVYTYIFGFASAPDCGLNYGWLSFEWVEYLERETSNVEIVDIGWQHVAAAVSIVLVYEYLK